MLKEEMAKLPKEEASLHLQRCIDSGMWVPEGGKKASAAAASVNSDDEEYEVVD